MVNPDHLLGIKIKWMSTGDATTPFESRLEGQQLLIMVNDFPADHLYTLVVNGKPVLAFDEWPDLWLRPAA